MRAIRFAVIAAVLFSFLEGCEVGPDYHPPPTTMPAAFTSMAPTTQPAIAANLTTWWRSLNDSDLNSLVDQAITANPDLNIALMRVQEARAQEYAVAGVVFPLVSADGAVGRGSGTDSVKGKIPTILDSGINTGKVSEVTEAVGLTGAWDLDLFGGLERELQASQYDVQAAAAARNDVLIAVISDVAEAYIDERGTQLRLAIAQADANAEQHSYDLVQSRFDRGFTNELDPAIAARELATVQAEIAPLQAAIQQDDRRLAVLLGRFPDELKMGVRQPAPLPTLPGRIAPGLPLDLLRRRPDIRLAERQLAASTARIGVAVDALYPHVFVAGALGVQGQGFGRTPLESSFIGSIGPGAYWPLLDFGTLDAQVERQDYATRALLLNYQRTVLNAVEQVDNAISNYSAEQDEVRQLAAAVTAAERAARIASQRYDRGFTNYLDVLDAQRELYGLQDQYASAQEVAVLQYIALYKALGGGWENYQSLPPIRRPQPAVLAEFHATR